MACCRWNNGMAGVVPTTGTHMRITRKTVGGKDYFPTALNSELLKPQRKVTYLAEPVSFQDRRDI